MIFPTGHTEGTPSTGIDLGGSEKFGKGWKSILNLECIPVN